MLAKLRVIALCCFQYTPSLFLWVTPTSAIYLNSNAKQDLIILQYLWLTSEGEVNIMYICDI
jgi:hypothetical protein